MGNITMLQLRKNAGRIIMRAKRGERMILSYRGKPVMRLEPIIEKANLANDSFFSLPDLSLEEIEPLDNKKMDSIIYGK